MAYLNEIFDGDPTGKYQFKSPNPTPLQNVTPLRAHWKNRKKRSCLPKPGFQIFASQTLFEV